MYAVTAHVELLAFRPFTVGELHDDLRAAGLQPALSTYQPEVDRYLVTACRAPDAGARAGPARPRA